MLLSAAEKDTGVLPGPNPSRVRINPLPSAPCAVITMAPHQLGDGYVDRRNNRFRWTRPHFFSRCRTMSRKSPIRSRPIW